MATEPSCRSSSMRALDVERWLLRAKPGAAITYHRGHLAADRAKCRQVDAVATYVLEHSTHDWLIVTPPPCGHVRGHCFGSGDLELRQRRVGPGVTEYVAVRR
jgi:hypothetical protein